MPELRVDRQVEVEVEWCAEWGTEGQREQMDKAPDTERGRAER